ncbi:MAG: transcription termination/antitermination protein NusG [Anaerolineae bacterium]|nr:transcription termination/antitermination protein NusG [Anaerolineae bacterium]
MPEVVEEAAATEAAADSQAEASVETPAEQVDETTVGETTDVADEAPAVAPSAPEAEDEEIVIRPLRKRGKATKTDKPKAPRKSAKKAENLPDPGDGSGYEAPYVPEGVDSPDEPQWYAVHCYSGYENKVKHNLEQRIETMGMADKIFEVVVPTEDEIEVRDGKRRTVERRVFPGYVMVRMKMSEDSWHVVRNTPGVTRFVGMGNRPQPLSPQEVNQILRRMEAEPPKIKVSFRVGQKVRITDGPFADFMGLVDKIDTERAKVTVLVSFFGRETPVELDFLQVEKM